VKKESKIKVSYRKNAGRNSLLKKEGKCTPTIFPKKLISKRKGVRKNDLKQWHPAEMRDWDIE